MVSDDDFARSTEFRCGTGMHHAPPGLLQAPLVCHIAGLIAGGTVTSSGALPKTEDFESTFGSVMQAVRAWWESNEARYGSVMI
jgi:hypothetical protein